MMLWNKTKNSQILSRLVEARTLWPRLKGLLGHRNLSETEGLWIHRCNSIHTFGMKFSIDCIFIDSKLKVRRVVENVKPGKLVWPIWGATSVIEVQAGFCQVKKIEVGDELNVGD